MRMLSNDDLHAIGSLIDVKFDAKFDEKLEPVLEAVREGFEGMEAKMATKADLSALRNELMDHTDRTVSKAVGDLRSELRERDLIG
jgi:hypothetical protein